MRKEEINKELIIILGIFIITFISSFTYYYKNESVMISKLVSSVVGTEKPANQYFDDINFYKAVIDAYNKENKTKISYDTNLTDEQLASIKEVNYYGLHKNTNEKISSTKGLEKLMGLTKLTLNSNRLKLYYYLHLLYLGYYNLKLILLNPLVFLFLLYYLFFH